MGSYDGELTEDQKSYLRERAEMTRQRWSMEWQPLHTAPRTGKRVLLARNNKSWGDRVKTGKWLRNCWHADGGSLWNDSDLVGWMPLPEPPPP